MQYHVVLATILTIITPCTGKELLDIGMAALLLPHFDRPYSRYIAIIRDIEIEIEIVQICKYYRFR